MYYIPKGKPMHEKLSTSFVRVEALLDELHDQRFTGYVVMTLPPSNGYIFLRGGQMLNAAEFGERERRVGKQIKEQLLHLAQQIRGTISVYYLPDEIVAALAGIADGEAVYEDLTSDFASLSKLIKRLTGERRLYFISLSFGDQPESGGLVYIEGDRVEAVCSGETELITGSEGLHRLIDESERRLATFSVYRAKQDEVPAFDEREVEISISRLAPQPAPPVPPTRTAPQPSFNESLLPSGTRAGEARTSFQPRPVVEEPDNILEVAELEAAPTGTTGRPGPVRAANVSNGRTPQSTPAIASVPLAPAAPATVPEPGTPESRAEDEMRELTALMSVVIAAVERGMTVAGRGSSFPTALRAGLLAVTEHYPFLDPFAAEFEYHDREIVFVGSAQPEEFATGLIEALRQMVEDLIYSSNGRVREYIAEELGKVEREQAGEIQRFNLTNLTERICLH
jgi:hypothetical protein